MTEGTVSNQAEPNAREVVLEVCRLFAQHRGLEAVERYFSPEYIEHNPDIPGGNLEGFRRVLIREGLDEPRGRDVAIELLNVVAEGAEVGIYLKAVEKGKPPLMIMEVYRVEGGRIVEHWDVMQGAPG